MATLDTQSVLKLLAAEYERSKQEQIERFLKDQEELNKRFSEFSLNSDGEKEEEDEDSDSVDSDTASVFTQRMSVYKSRPQTSMGWTDLDTECGSDERSEGSGNCNAIESDSEDWKSAVANAGNTKSAKDRQSRNQTQHHLQQKGPNNLAGETNRNQITAKGPVENQLRETDRLRPPDAATRLLTKRSNVRPRTATGIRTRTRIPQNCQNGEPEKEDTFEEDTVTRSRPMRASAPATVSRVRRISWEPENNKPENNKPSFLPDTRQNRVLQKHPQPSYATTNYQVPTAVSGVGEENKRRTSHKSTQLHFDTSNYMIISSMGPQFKNNTDKKTDVSTSRNLRRLDSNQEQMKSRDRRLPSLEKEVSGKSRHLAVLKLPPLSSESAQKIGSSPDYVQSTPTQRNSLTQNQEYEFLAG